MRTSLQSVAAMAAVAGVSVGGVAAAVATAPVLIAPTGTVSGTLGVAVDFLRG